MIGSINYDLFLMQDRIPLRGETLLARGVREGFGGKGANQAVQAARLGRKVAFVGAVGSDDRGTASIANLREQGIDCHVDVVAAPTGLGVVNVLGDGSVFATVVPGANLSVTVDRVQAAASLLEAAQYVILQNEIPVPTVRAAMELARHSGAKVVYNAAPMNTASSELARGCDVLIVNEEEAMALLGRRLEDLTAIRNALPELEGLCPQVIVTAGEHGAYTCHDGKTRHVAPMAVQAVDTTGAGDSFVGAFTSALVSGATFDQAASLASAVAAETTTGVGAQTSMPTSMERGGSDDSLRASSEDPSGSR
ncbi:ribokinase [Luteococcus sp. H91]|uniref:ribokinase n=1 Tax=Luteococcus sp. H91 TaxID=3139401 RepID=UPI00313A767B